MKNLLLLAATLVILCSGCEKDHGPVIRKDKIVLVNKYNSQPIHVDIYANLTDYNSRTNIVYSGMLPVKGYLPLPDSTLARGTKYYCDLYSDDHLYSNWTDSYWQQITTAAAAAPDTIIVACNYAPHQHIFLGDTNLEMHWRAVDRYRWNSSDWYMLTDTQKYREVTLRRDGTGQVKSKDETGNITTVDILSVIPGSTGEMEVLFMADESGNGNKYKLLNSPISPLNNPTYRKSADTIIFEDYFAYWVMVRQ